MNILQLSGVSSWGGGEHHIENLCKELALTHPEIHNIIFCVEDSVFHQRLKDSNIEFITAPLSLKLDLRYALKLGKTCKQKNIDLIHIHDPTALQLAIIADKMYSLPPFVYSKKTSFEIKDRKMTLYKYNYPKIKKILCVSNETLRVSKRAILDHDKLFTIYHGTNIRTKSNQTPFLLRDKYALDPNKIIVGNIANHIPAKDLETLINVADHIVNHKKQTNFFFVQIGTFTKDTQALIDRVNELNLNTHLVFLGYTPNAANFIPQFNISLMTSESEGVPQFIYESMYHNVPVVSTNVGGIAEIVEHGVNGLLAPMHDAKKLSQNVLTLIEQPQLKSQFTKESQRLLTSRFTTSQMAQHTVKIYQDIINET